MASGQSNDKVTAYSDDTRPTLYFPPDAAHSRVQGPPSPAERPRLGDGGDQLQPWTYLRGGFLSNTQLVCDWSARLSRRWRHQAGLSDLFLQPHGDCGVQVRKRLACLGGLAKIRSSFLWGIVIGKIKNRIGRLLLHTVLRPQQEELCGKAIALPHVMVMGLVIVTVSFFFFWSACSS